MIPANHFLVNSVNCSLFLRHTLRDWRVKTAVVLATRLGGEAVQAQTSLAV
jgi:hypothetical protein